MARLRVEVEGTPRSVERDDVLAWAGRDPDADDGGDLAALAAAYVTAHPRPTPDAQGGVNVAARQRAAILRRLAAGPASRGDLLAAMRAASGYVGGDDWRNRLDELRGRGQRGGGHVALPIAEDPETGSYRFTEPFPALSAEDRRTAGRLKGLAAETGDEAGRLLLDALLPGVEAAEPVDGQGSSSGSQRSSPRTAASSRR